MLNTNRHSIMLAEQENLAKAQQTAAEQTVADFQRDLEERYEIPIFLEYGLVTASCAGMARPYWEQRTKVLRHSIAMAPRAPWFLPQVLAHELTHIQLECEANTAGRRKTHCQLPASIKKVLGYCDPTKRGDKDLLKSLFSYSLNVPVDLVVESRLQRRFPVLAPAQFVSAHRFEEKNEENYPATLNWDVSPRLRLAYDALTAVHSLFVDRTMAGGVRHFDRFSGHPAGDLAIKLYAEFQTYLDHNPEPDAHYLLVNRFAELIELRGLHDWLPQPIFELKDIYHISNT